MTMIDGAVTSSRSTSSATHSSAQSSTPPASVRRLPTKLVTPRASSSSKTQQSRKPIPTSIPTVRHTTAGPDGPTGKPPPGISTENPAAVMPPDQHVSAKSSVAVVRQLSADFDAADAVPDSAGGTGSLDAVTTTEPSTAPVGQASTEAVTMLTGAGQSAPSSTDLAPSGDVTDGDQSALSVAPMQPMTTRAYMSSSGNPMMTSRLLSASQRPFTPVVGTWGGRVRQRLTNGYVSDSDVRPLAQTYGGLRQSGYTSERRSSSAQPSHTCNLSGFHTMPRYLENVDDDEDR